jgi:hypothetical protein
MRSANLRTADRNFRRLVGCSIVRISVSAKRDITDDLSHGHNKRSHRHRPLTLRHNLLANLYASSIAAAVKLHPATMTG